MQFDFNKIAVSRAFRFYARVLSFPYDELTHELQHLFREVEKNIETDVDNTIASKILDIINFYQGEDMHALQAEFARLFTPVDEQPPLISLNLSDILPDVNFNDLIDQLFDSALSPEIEENPESVVPLLEHFSSMFEYESEVVIEEFFSKYIKNSLPALSEKIFQCANLNFYRECARGLNELTYFLD